MPYAVHTECRLTASDDDQLWRYMDIWKYLSLLDSQSLFFSRALLLPDKFEGTYSPATVEVFSAISEAASQIMDSTLHAVKQVRLETVVNCWYRSAYESETMWGRYFGSSGGIAVQTTVGSLKKCFATFPGNVHVGEIRYMDYDNEQMSITGWLGTFMHKRKEYESENEIRAIIPRADLLTTPATVRVNNMLY